MALGLIPLGIVAAGCGLGLGLSYPWDKGHETRDVHPIYPTLLMLNTTGISAAAYHGMNISAAEEITDQRAVFSWMAGRSEEGVLTGFCPDSGRDGIMQGGFNFAHNKTTNATGTWIAVDQSVADEETGAAFRYLLEVAEAVEMEGATMEGVEARPHKSVTLEYMLHAAKEIFGKAH